MSELVLEDRDILTTAGTPSSTDDAMKVEKARREAIYEAKETTQTSAVISELAGLVSESDRVSAKTLSVAIEFADALPFYVAQPEVSVDPDGEIAFDWIDDNNNMLSISIGPERGVTYAGKFRAGVFSGTANFRESIPHSLGEALKIFRANQEGS